MRTACILLLTFFFFGNTGLSQTYLTISGKVLDKKTNKPVAYAHVGIPEKGIGSTTAHDGSFAFKVPERYKNSTVIVSFMGYKTYKNPIQAFKNNSIIYIEESSSELAEVVVMGQNAIEDIIRKAVKNIPKNYAEHPTTVLGFYRESLTDDSLRYRYLAEGVLNIYKTSYKSRKEGQVSLVQARKINLKDPLDTTVYSGLSSGHMAAHRFDFVKHREDFIDESYFPAYKYWIESITTYNDRPVYIIGFEKDENGTPTTSKSNGWSNMARAFTGRRRKKNTIKKARMKGRIFIEQGSYAMIRAEFEITPQGLRQINDYPLYVGDWEGNKYIVNYRKVGDKWYFSDALREGERGRGGIYANEIKITEINTEKSEPLPYLERMNRGYQFVNLTGSYDENFWKNYNTTPLSAGLAESVQQLKNMQKAEEVFDPEYMAALQQKRDSITAAKLLEEREKYAEAQGIDLARLDELEYVPEELRRINTVREKFSKVNFLMGINTHLITTQNDPLDINYVDKDGLTILAVNDDISKKDFEIMFRWELDIYLKKYLFIRFGNAFDFSKSLYKDWTLGAGTRFNLSKKRPVFFKTAAQYSYLRYARVVGSADNDYGKFKVDNKKFKAESIRLSYGSRLHNLKLSGELSIELNPDRELYFRGSYYWTFASQENMWFKERKELFRKKERTRLTNDRLTVLENDVPFNDRITPQETLSFTVGLLFK